MNISFSQLVILILIFILCFSDIKVIILKLKTLLKVIINEINKKNTRKKRT